MEKKTQFLKPTPHYSKVLVSKAKNTSNFSRELKETPAFIALADPNFLENLCAKYAISLTEGEYIAKKLTQTRQQKPTYKRTSLEPEERILD